MVGSRRRTVGTTLGLVGGLALAAVFAPMPADAAADPISGFLSVLACLFVLAIVLAVTATVVLLIGYAAYWLVRGGWGLARRVFGIELPGGGGRLNDASVLVVAGLAVGAASLEGVSAALTFPERDTVASTVEIGAPQEAVWAAIGKASSTALELPTLLRLIPRPTHVQDGGAALGSRRVVHFKGREGEGDLVLEVTSRSGQSITWTAVSDSTPMRGWAKPRTVTYTVAAAPERDGSRLTVSAVYDRKLAPAWFFRPNMQMTSTEVVDVLARDKKERAEQLARP